MSRLAECNNDTGSGLAMLPTQPSKTAEQSSSSNKHGSSTTHERHTHTHVHTRRRAYSAKQQHQALTTRRDQHRAASAQCHTTRPPRPTARTVHLSHTIVGSSYTSHTGHSNTTIAPFARSHPTELCLSHSLLLARHRTLVIGHSRSPSISTSREQTCLIIRPHPTRFPSPARSSGLIEFVRSFVPLLRLLPACLPRSVLRSACRW